MLRRLYPEQPDSFEFTPENLAWAKAQMTKFPVGRQASAIIPLLFRAQEQEGWLSRPAIEYVAEMLDMPYMRALEVATFYFMFQLAPVGSVAHLQICGTTSCMICGAEDLMKVCKEKIAPEPFQLSEDGKFSWEEVECLGACANAPMMQVGKDYYEDLTEESLAKLIDEMGNGTVPKPGSQTGRFSSEPASGLTALTETKGDKEDYNYSVARALAIGDTIKRIDGTEVPLEAPWQSSGQRGPIGTMGQERPRSAAQQDEARKAAKKTEAKPAKGTPADKTGVTEAEAPATSKSVPRSKREPVGTEADAKADTAVSEGEQPKLLDAPRDGGADDLKMIKGVGPKLETLLHSMGIYHFDQIAAWSDAELAWVDANLEGFKGRASRDDWKGQAEKLASGAETEFSSRAKKDGIYE
ncbi:MULTISPECIES: NADH-quinone oxidoreductase subunit E [Thioclava]|uniref:NADH-quinone oxidoreductase subunit E n=1 Tax=Thioclava TaxID=285107 RepID=UPI000B53AC0F|nr:MULTISPECIES: NADH-quinone oxidoreductase subunit E [Thioclava]OWY05466.1 NADH-quinone oxidoreductase subunit E [Thioclava sp. F1Mire-8]OWY10754.1 NADH-quinone oxidoreductase subunit E [Thioclava sp. F42-5]WGT50722.1 NADH-quinone oxidoreductase subunit E [Thioclava nitratireducens]